ncbi:Sec-independent protein translocase protein TatB [Yoonia vestfoldensis]|uniref:Sec-independent protein translocase protein TatB n=1 Tax=Yoonia vestfoldensis TaxID=245188 RepID=A0A1Y0EA34_9RHOB|nr:Sec-independent protein translocase protein TatB [Yoonia vestfoldensis]ARU00466.1 Sec-independent protein translocase protein TatB [Yoonia vestfoldensis]
MFGLGMSEMVLIGIVALIVIGPKDLPGMFRAMGQFTGKARGMAREFSRAMEAAADESGIKDMTKTIRAASDPKAFGAEALKDATSFSKAPATQDNAARAAVKAAPAKAAPKPNPAKTAPKPNPPKTASKPPASLADKPEDKA